MPHPFKTGQSFDLGQVQLTKEEIKDFAAKYDPQPMHLDEEAAQDSLLKGLAASGWQTIALVRREATKQLLIDTSYLRDDAVPEIRWRSPARPDTPMVITAEVDEALDNQATITYRMNGLEDTQILIMTATHLFGGADG